MPMEPFPQDTSNGHLAHGATPESNGFPSDGNGTNGQYHPCVASNGVAAEAHKNHKGQEAPKPMVAGAEKELKQQKAQERMKELEAKALQDFVGSGFCLAGTGGTGKPATTKSASLKIQGSHQGAATGATPQGAASNRAEGQGQGDKPQQPPAPR